MCLQKIITGRTRRGLKNPAASTLHSAGFIVFIKIHICPEYYTQGDPLWFKLC